METEVSKSEQIFQQFHIFDEIAGKIVTKNTWICNAT